MESISRLSALKKEAVLDEAVLSLGYTNLKQQQKDAVLGFISGRDVFVALPTGYGKSLVYGCLPRVFDMLLDEHGSIVIVVCPLKALMEDQAISFQDLGIAAAYVGDKNTSFELFVTGQIQLIFISPESLNKGSVWRDIIKSDIYQQRTVGFVVDEAHLIKTETSPEKENLYFSVVKFESISATFQPLLQELMEKRTNMDRTLIFCRNLIDCANLWIKFCKFLGPNITEPPNHDIKIPELRMVDCYTGCTDECVRTIVLKQFSTSSCLRVLIATIAFGLGVNCPDIRHIIHFGIPEDVESYVQQVGRAGRDGKHSRCTMLYGSGVYKKHCNEQILKYCQNNHCRRDALYSNFGSYSVNTSLSNTCKCCDVCSSFCKCCN